MNYSGIIYNDIANGNGIRTSLFVSGCRNHCEGCFNKECQDFNYGEPYTEEIENNIINSINNDYIKGLTLLGGDPLEPENAKDLISLVTKVKDIYKDSKDIWLYTGYTKEYLESINNEDINKILSLIDVLVDGPFILEQRDIRLRFRGSTNQKIWIKDSSNNFILDPNQ